MNEYIKRIIEEVSNKNSNEIEFLETMKEILTSIAPFVASHPEFEENGLLERFLEPERVIEFRVPWIDDFDKVRVNRGYRVQFNSAIGPYKGGLRFDKTVNLSIMKFLSLEQTLKNSLTGLSMGGAKGGSDFDPKGKSDREIMRFCQSFMLELYRHIGEDVDIPAGDIGVGAREIGYLFGEYKKIKNNFVGALTGKNISFGGSFVRNEATGFGLCYFTNKMLEVMKNTSFEGKKVIISGSGNVALYTLKKAKELGATVLAMSDSNGYIYNEKGIDFDILQDIKENKHLRIKEYIKYDKEATYFDISKNIWKIKCDIALPCATQYEIDLDMAKELVKNGVMCVAEGANMPCTLEASNYFIEHKVLYGPSKAANCGGVMVSGFEMAQDSSRLSWTFKKVDSKLKDQMEFIFKEIYECAKEYNDEYNTLKGANIVAFKKVAKAMMMQGII